MRTSGDDRLHSFFHDGDDRHSKMFGTIPKKLERLQTFWDPAQSFGCIPKLFGPSPKTFWYHLKPFRGPSQNVFGPIKKHSGPSKSFFDRSKQLLNIPKRFRPSQNYLGPCPLYWVRLFSCDPPMWKCCSRKCFSEMRLLILLEGVLF